MRLLEFWDGLCDLCRIKVLLVTFGLTAATLLIAQTCVSGTAQAQEAPLPPEADAGAIQNVEPSDGAVEGLPVDSTEAESEGDVGEAPEAPPEQPTYAPVVGLSGYQQRVRLTYYLLTGVTYSGQYTRAGGTACSWNFRIGQRFQFPHGEIFVCNDRGHLGDSGWLDVWKRPDLQRMYGQYVTVRVL